MNPKKDTSLRFGDEIMLFQNKTLKERSSKGKDNYFKGFLYGSG